MSNGNPNKLNLMQPPPNGDSRCWNCLKPTSVEELNKGDGYCGWCVQEAEKRCPSCGRSDGTHSSECGRYDLERSTSVVP